MRILSAHAKIAAAATAEESCEYIVRSSEIGVGRRRSRI